METNETSQTHIKPQSPQFTGTLYDEEFPECNSFEGIACADEDLSSRNDGILPLHGACNFRLRNRDLLRNR